MVPSKCLCTKLFIGYWMEWYAVALLATNSPIGIPFAALLYGVLSVGKSGMIGVPPEVIDVVSALIIFFVGANYIIRYWVRPRQSQ